MPRSSNGTCTLAEPAFVPLTNISSALVNNDLSDIADMLTDSLSRSGDGAMTAVLQLDPTEGMAFSNDLDTGIQRTGANTITIEAGGVEALTLTPTTALLFGSPLLTLPVGVMMPYGGTSAPASWLLCYGQAVSRTTYSSLWNTIGTAYGAGDGSTTFNVPDMRGRSAFGKDDMGGSAANRITNAVSGITGTTLGASGGSQSVTLDLTMIPSHDHGGATGNDNPSLSAITSIGSTNADTPGTPVSVSTSPTTTALTHTHSITAAGGGLAHNNMPPTLIFNMIIYAGA